MPILSRVSELHRASLLAFLAATSVVRIDEKVVSYMEMCAKRKRTAWKTKTSSALTVVRI